MIKSMTGFASLGRDDAAATVNVTVRSVNHRYLDLQVRLPAALAELEARLRNRVQAFVGRGRVELAVSLHAKQAPAPVVELNDSVVDAVAAAVARARAHGLVEGQLTAGDLLRIPQALTIREAAGPERLPPALAEAIVGAVDTALAELDAMRAREGEFLRADLEERCRSMERLVDQIEAAAGEGRTALEHRLLERARDLAREFEVEPAAIAQEVVRAAARSDTTEELVRLRGHLTHWRLLADAPEPCGRKLDFLLQEMNREINTIGAKVEGAAATELVLDAKAELEKMREQVQNVE